MIKNNLSVVNLSTYTSPEIRESKNEDYVEFGEENNYFNYLIDRFNNSPTNGAVINSISQMIYGRGLDATNSHLKPEQFAMMISLFKKDEVRKLASDLKLTGQCAIQVIYSKDRKRILKTDHFPIETLRAEKLGKDDKEVQAYYYHPKWEDKKRNEKLLRIPAFGVGNKRSEIEILYVKPYKAGMYYYATPDYISAIQYCEMEEEIATFHNANIKNSFAPASLINFNNGVPDERTQREIERKITDKFQGTSNAGKLIVSFNDNKETQADITPIQISEAHNTYQFISEEAKSKIMLAHRVVSPMLLGVKDNSGFGNNAEELSNSSILMDNMVIRPFQDLLTDAFDKILAYNNVSLNLYFKTLQPLQFIDLENVKDKETQEEETGVKMSKQDFDDDEMLDALEGENIDDEWELVDEREFSEDNEDIETWASGKIKEKLNAIQKLADFIKSNPNGESKLDKSFYKVRYKYAEKYSSGNSRKFCKLMMGRSAKGVVYRKEDIDQASFSGVNKELGHKQNNYSLFKFKGGVNCGHFWNEQLYRLKNKTEKGTKYVSKYDEVDAIPNTYNPNPVGNKESKIAPKDMTGKNKNGHHPDWNAKYGN